jgi:peptidoglycan/xylan/chitin deacetylase (PgdA/CDA1 family)
VVDADGEVRFVAGAVVRTEDIVQAVHEALKPRKDGGSLYLTFDDFPPKTGGDELLDMLRALGVKATLFCMGSRVEAEPKLLRRALAEGHSLQVHSWDHDAERPQLERCQEVFRRVLGIHPKLYRAPGSEVIVGEPKHHRIVDPYDYTRPSKKELLRRILPAVCPEAVIQLHAGVSVTIAVLQDLVEDLSKRGFRFGVLGEQGL